MIKANFQSYSTYTTDSLYQWDINQILSVMGLNLITAPTVHFSNANMDKAIVRQATLENHVVSVKIPNSLLQEALTIKAYIGIYESDTFKVIELVEIPVIPRERPYDYQIQDSDEEIYSFEALKNDIANMVTLSDFNTNNTAITARIDNIIAHNNDTDGNTELVDIRLDTDGNVYDSAGNAVRSQITTLIDDLKLFDNSTYVTFSKYANWIVGSLENGVLSEDVRQRIVSSNMLHFDRDIHIKVATGYQIYFNIFDEKGKFVSESERIKDSFLMPADTYFKIVVSRPSVTFAGNVTDLFLITNLSSGVTFSTYAGSKLKNLDDLMKVCDSALRLTNSETFYPKGSYYGGDNSCVHAADIACNSVLVVTSHNRDPGYCYCVDLYTDDGLRNKLSSSGWMKMAEIPFYIVAQDCLVDISITKLNEGSFSALSEMNGLISVDAYNRLSNLEKSVSILNRSKKKWLTSVQRGQVDSELKENSLGAFYNAYINGADVIEVDARFSNDGVLVCSHDPIISGINSEGKQVEYTVADTIAYEICSLRLSNGSRWGNQYVPSLEQVLNFAYHTGLIVNIDLKDAYEAVEAAAKLVLRCGMQGKVIYRLNGAGMDGINTILAIDPKARFIDSDANFISAVAGYAERGERCFCQTSSLDDDAVNAIRTSGCMLALINLNAENFEKAITYYPDMCEYLQTADFNAIENNYFDSLTLYSTRYRGINYKDESLKNEEIAFANVISSARGRGTVDVYVWAKSGEPSTELVAEVQNQLYDISDQGVDVRVIAATGVSCNLYFTLWVEDGYVYNDVKNECVVAVKDCINSLDIGVDMALERACNALFSIPGVKNYKILTSSCSDVTIEYNQKAIAGAVGVAKGS